MSHTIIVFSTRNIIHISSSGIYMWPHGIHNSFKCPTTTKQTNTIVSKRYSAINQNILVAWYMLMSTWIIYIGCVIHGMEHMSYTNTVSWHEAVHVTPTLYHGMEHTSYTNTVSWHEAVHVTPTLYHGMKLFMLHQHCIMAWSCSCYTNTVSWHEAVHVTPTLYHGMKLFMLHQHCIMAWSCSCYTNTVSWHEAVHVTPTLYHGMKLFMLHQHCIMAWSCSWWYCDLIMRSD